jgi:hypothetical protein
VNRTLELVGNIAGAVLGGALVALTILITISDCGPDGYGQRECLEEWSSAVAAAVAGR